MRRQPVIFILLVSSLILLFLISNVFAIIENWVEVKRFTGAGGIGSIPIFIVEIGFTLIVIIIKISNGKIGLR